MALAAGPGRASGGRTDRSGMASVEAPDGRGVDLNMIAGWHALPDGSRRWTPASKRHAWRSGSTTIHPRTDPSRALVVRMHLAWLNRRHAEFIRDNVDYRAASSRDRPNRCGRRRARRSSPGRAPRRILHSSVAGRVRPHDYRPHERDSSQAARRAARRVHPPRRRRRLFRADLPDAWIESLLRQVIGVAAEDVPHIKAAQAADLAVGTLLHGIGRR